MSLVPTADESKVIITLKKVVAKTDAECPPYGAQYLSIDSGRTISAGFWFSAQEPYEMATQPPPLPTSQGIP